MGALLKTGLEELQRKFEAFGDVRGKGKASRLAVEHLEQPF